ncbi:MAG: hypothetical protein EP315_08085 [Gammaproteobacteria bacterium]|nr:MAG: hypothetical protein EP315_08085 [Gammaproteobacteria bacterium]
MIKQLHQYIGCEITHEGIRCQLIEVLEDGPSLVFLNLEHSTAIQSDQYGSAHRKVQKTYTVPVLSDIHDDLHPAVKAVLPEELHDELLAFLTSD